MSFMDRISRRAPRGPGELSKRRDPSSPLLAVTVTAGLVVALLGISHNAAAASGTFVLMPGEILYFPLSGFVQLGAGQQIHWNWTATLLVGFRLEQQGAGLFYGDETGTSAGCARADVPVAVRASWSNDQTLLRSEPARVDYSFVVEPADLACATIGNSLALQMSVRLVPFLALGILVVFASSLAAFLFVNRKKRNLP